MGSFSRSFALLGASWGVLMADRSLLIFPVLSGALTILAAIIFIFPAFVFDRLAVAAGGKGNAEPVLMILLFLFYIITSFITLFFNTALVAVTLDRLRGGQATIGDGFRVAFQNLPSIIGFSIISATVGMILNVMQSRSGILGGIVSSLMGAAWSIVTFLVVPVMVAERQNAFRAIKRSTELLRQTWGTQIIGNGGLGLAVFLIGLIGALPLVIGAISGHPVFFGIGAAISVLYWGILAVIATALGQIFRTAVYVYAEGGSVAAGFDSDLIARAFRPK